MKTALALAKACTLFQFFYELRVVNSLELFLFLGGLLSSLLLRCHVQPPFERSPLKFNLKGPELQPASNTLDMQLSWHKILRCVYR